MNFECRRCRVLYVMRMNTPRTQTHTHTDSFLVGKEGTGQYLLVLETRSKRILCIQILYLVPCLISNMTIPGDLSVAVSVAVSSSIAVSSTTTH